ncbi:hypothetical protein LOK49_LG05G01640 [Camellia lanceoleosa]|uniref:Uncharacterized protein n=1 Tax=Camellia lanceoleosa TaxID=1840588 RepID=A0ACC0HKW9_9ERIC|nr:hypothetical protein LOK49_LG05G01640 [Camellia lanceoleosa]
MESLSIGLSSSPAFQNLPKTHKPTLTISIPSLPNSISTSISFNSHPTHLLSTKKIIPHSSQPQPLSHRSNPTPTTHFPKLFHINFPILKTHSFLPIFLKSQLSFLSMGLYFPLCSFASDTSVITNEVPNKINLESILVSIDEFFNRYPFFVAGVTFIWLVVIPLTEEFLQKYKFISAIDAFRKLRADPNAQLLDIRDKKSLQYLSSPNLKFVNKSAVQVEFREGDEEGFVNKVLEKFTEPANTVICVLDNFDGNSMKVAELLFKNGFKEAYAIRGGVRGENGWQAIQETLLPLSVHIYPKKKVKMPKKLGVNGGVSQQSNNQATSSTTLSVGQSEKVDNGYVNKAIETTQHANNGSRSLSPYPNYPDMKPPSSPTPSKP